MSFIRLKRKGMNIDIRAAAITAYMAEESGTVLLMADGDEVRVDESFQAVRNRIAKAEAGESSDD